MQYKIGSIVKIKSFEELIRGGVLLKTGLFGIERNKVRMQDGRVTYISDLKKIAGARVKLLNNTKDPGWYTAIKLKTAMVMFVTDFMIEDYSIKLVKCETEDGEKKRIGDAKRREERRKHNEKVMKDYRLKRGGKKK